MSDSLPKLWTLTADLETKEAWTFTEIQQQGYNPRTLSHALRKAQDLRLVKKVRRSYSLTPKGKIFAMMSQDIQWLLDSAEKVNIIPRSEIRSFLSIYVPLLRSHYRKRLLGVALFGSSSTQTWKPESDIDILVIVKKWQKPTWERASELYFLTEEALKVLDKPFDIPISHYPLDEAETYRFHPIYPDLSQDAIILTEKDSFLNHLLQRIKELLLKEKKIRVVTPDGESLWITQRR